MPPKVETTYYLREFQEDLLLSTKFCRLAFIGKTNSGKSQAVKTLCHFYRNRCWGGFAHSISEPQQGFFRQFIPQSFIYSEKNIHRLGEVYEAQKSRVQMFKKMVENGVMKEDEAQRRCHMLIILDDMNFLGDAIFKDDLIKEVWMNGRHSWITVFITLQYSKGIGPMLRDQIDWVFLWQDPAVNSQKKLFEDWVGYFPSLADFKRVFNSVTGQYRCMVVRKISGGKTDVESNVFCWKPKLIEQPFSIGVKEYRLFDKYLIKELKRKRKEERENGVRFKQIKPRG